MQEPFLQKWQSSFGIGFSGLKDDYWSPRFVVGGIKPIAEWESAITMWFVAGFIVKIVDWDAEVVGWVQEGGIDVIAFG